MIPNQTIRLLILNDERSEAERLISMLNNSGRPVRAQHVDSNEGLEKLLRENSWDLLIGHDQTQGLKPQDAIRTIRKYSKDIACILQTDSTESHTVVEGIKLGAKDVVILDEDQHLLMVISRELEARSDRERRRIAERAQKEVERRNQQLLDSSRDAIAFIQDGMFLYANDSFAESLGYQSRDEIECMPVIDVVADKDQERIKKFLKDFFLKADESESVTMTFEFIDEQEIAKPLALDINKALFDDESCIQFIVGTDIADNQELEAQIQQIKNQDLATGLFNKNHLLTTIDHEVDKAIHGVHNCTLMQISIDKFTDTVRDKAGISSLDIAIGEIAHFAKSCLDDGDTLYRYSEETFVLLSHATKSNKAQENAENLCNKLRDNIIDLNGLTLQFNYHIGIAFINEISTDANTPIEHAHKALERCKQENSLAQIYEPEITSNSRHDIAVLVQRALDQNRFKLLFQPILSLRGSEKEHYEVLLRMLDESGTEILPDTFLTEAARTGATTKIDRWVILQSIKTLSEHRQAGHNTQLIINLSRESMLDATLPDWLKVAFKAIKLPPEAVIFQLKEMDINDHLNVASQFTHNLSDAGFTLSVNHFGCALSPMKTLESIAVKYIKIDGSFTQEIQQNQQDVQSLNELISDLNQKELITIVPFVENASVLSKLWQSGVHYIQGFYLQEPVDEMNYDFDTES